MGITSELIVRIAANAEEFRSEMGKVAKETLVLEDQLKVAAKISGAAFAAGTAAIAGAVIAATNFENKFTDVVTLLDKASFSTMNLDQGIDSLKKGVIQLGQETGESFDSLNKALFDLISAGVPADKALATLKATTHLAAAGATDTATAVQALTASMTAFGEKAGTATEISEKFFTAQKFGVTTVGDLAGEFSKVAGASNALGISFDETLSSLAALTADGAKPTNVAATQLKATLTSIINIQKDLGKESTAVQQALSLQNLEQKGLVGALTDLKAATGGNVVEMQRLLGSAESLSVALSLTGPQASLVSKILGEMGDSEKRAATFAEALAVKQETSKKAFDKFFRTIEAGAIIIGDVFAPMLSKVADLFSSIFQVLTNNPVLAKTAALFLGIGTALSGVALAAALGSTAFLQIRAAMIALNITTKVLALGLKGLVGATGIGLLLIVAVEVYNNWSVIWPAVTKIFAATVTSISSLASALGKILKGVFTFDSKAISEGMDEAKAAITKGLDDMAKAVKSNPDVAIDVPVTATADEQAINDAAKAASDAAKKEADEQKKIEQDKTKFLNDEQKTRIADNQAALDILKLQRQKASAEEIDLVRRKNQLELDEQKALLEKNESVRNSDLELIKMQKAILIEDEKKFNEKKKEIDQINREEKAALDEEFKLLSKEQQATFNEEELYALQDNILTKQEIENQAAAEKLQAQIDARNKYLEDEIKHGAAVAKLNQVLGSETVKLAKESANELVALTQSKNDTLKSIGKAAAVAQITIDTAQGAASIFAKLNALVPFLAPAIGAAGAAAIVAFGAEKTSNVLAANTGGMVPTNMGIPGKDSVNALLTPGELVVPEKNFDEVVGSVAAQRSGSTTTQNPDEGQGSKSLDLRILLEPVGDLVEYIEKQIIERRVQGIGLL